MASSKTTIGEFMVKTWCKQNDKSFVIVRPFNTYGTRMTNKWIWTSYTRINRKSHDEDEFFIYGDGSQTRSFCHVKDHVDILYKLIQNCDNEVLNVGFDEEITIHDLTKNILDEFGYTSKPINTKLAYNK